jgi:metallophosphoesterase (TIGR00282 family)
VIKIFALGDIMGRAGRHCFQSYLPEIKKKYAPDVIIVNGENVAGGYGITEALLQELTEEFGVQVVTTGNHWHDKKEIKEFHIRYPQLLLPANMYNVKDLQHGYCILETASGIPYAVINITARLYMKGDNRSPFLCLDEILAQIPASVKVRVVDIHGEATSEKQAFAHYATGRVSLVYGTHTHCPTADERILAGKTGYLTDVGMTGAYDSVIGVRKELSLKSFLTKERPRFEPASEDPWLCAVVATVDTASGHCVAIERVKWTGGVAL